MNNYIALSDTLSSVLQTLKKLGKAKEGGNILKVVIKHCYN